MKCDDSKDSIKPMSLLSLILSFMALFVISGLLFFPLSAETRQAFISLDFIICSIFLLQLTLDFMRSDQKMRYIKRHWIDILASLPMIEPLRYARVFQILRVILVISSSKNILNQLKENRKETALASIVLIMVLLITLGSSVMLSLERHAPDANITNGIDALWWAFVTISTVGYGDHYPVTVAGKLLAMYIILSGVGIFGTISGLITSIITAPPKKIQQQQQQQNDLLLEIAQQQKEILRRLDQLERHSQTKK